MGRLVWYGVGLVAISAIGTAFLSSGSEPTDPARIRADINASIKQQLAYEPRNEEGTQTPIETLERASGTCRDFAFLMMEALRQLGIARDPASLTGRLETLVGHPLTIGRGLVRRVIGR